MEPASTTWTMTSTSTTVGRHLMPPALLRVTSSSRTGMCPGRTAASSTPRARALALGVGRGPDRPDSALSNFSELDSGYDELRSFTVTPVNPPEILVTAPPQDAARPDLLPAEMTSSSVDNEEEKPDDDGDFEDNKSISEEESELGQSVALTEDRCNTSSIIEHEDLLSVNTGTGNSSAVSLSSLEAADSCGLGAHNSECETIFSFIILFFLSLSLFAENLLLYSVVSYTPLTICNYFFVFSRDYYGCFSINFLFIVLLLPLMLN